jgi:hypothetical protein
MHGHKTLRSFCVQHYTATIIVVLLRQMVQLYEKASFVLYSMKIECTSLTYSNNYS